MAILTIHTVLIHEWLLIVLFVLWNLHILLHLFIEITLAILLIILLWYLLLIILAIVLLVRWWIDNIVLILLGWWVLLIFKTIHFLQSASSCSIYIFIYMSWIFIWLLIWLLFKLFRCIMKPSLHSSLPLIPSITILIFFRFIILIWLLITGSASAPFSCWSYFSGIIFNIFFIFLWWMILF